MDTAVIAGNVAHVRARIEQACARTGRSVGAVTLIAVTKTVEPARIAADYAAGVRHFGENYVQEALRKMEQPPLDRPDVLWHFIGHLQRNKARDVVGRFALIHSVDSIPLAQALGRYAARSGQSVSLLLEVKLDPNETKFGIAPETVLEAARAIEPIASVRLRGLMGMAPYSQNPEDARPFFRQLYRLFTHLPAATQQVLSMGMSGDFEVAIEEGATHVRIGTAIFGVRRPKETTR